MPFSGFNIQKQTPLTGATELVPLFQKSNGNFTAVNNVGGFTEFVTSSPHSVIVGDFVQVTGGVYDQTKILVTAIPDNTHFITNLAFSATDTGVFVVLDSFTITDSSSLLLIQLHFYFEVDITTTIEMSKDGGGTYQLLTNNAFLGSTLFPFNMLNGESVNFRAASGAASFLFKAVIVSE